MTKKAILLVRVSTQRQDFDEQEKQLYYLAIKDGYKDNEIVAIAEKESGIKLSEEERKGLNRLKEEISNGGVKCVYVWEVSRIGRKKKVIFSIVELLQSHGIQLIVKEPFIKLLNPDGSINEGAETILTLYAQMAESEMRNKLSRWARTKKANSAKGKWNGGQTVKFGYTIDKDNYYIIDDSEAEIVRLIYKLYTDNAMSYNGIVKELNSRGIIITSCKVRAILNDIGYTGEEYITTVWHNGKRAEGQKIVYPQIVSKEIYEQVARKRAKANRTVTRGESYYFARQLIKCAECGHSYIGYKDIGMYVCVAYKHTNHDIPKCHNNNIININILDTLLWYDAKGEYINYLTDARKVDRNTYNEQIDVLTQKIKQCNKIIQSAQSKIEKIGDMYVSGVYTKDKFKLEISKVKASAKEGENNKTKYIAEIQKITEIMNNIDNEDVTDNYLNSLAMTDNIDDYKEMYEIVHKFITNVKIENTVAFEGAENVHKKGVWKRVTVTHLDGQKTVYIANYYGKLKKFYTLPYLVNITKDEAKKIGKYYLDITDEIHFINRDVGRRKRY